MQLISFNVNSIRIRLPAVLKLLEDLQPTALILQELKADDSQLDWQAVIASGYHVHAIGQTAYNGVAVITRQPSELIRTALPSIEDPQARYLEVRLSSGETVVGLYAPNGNPVLADDGQLSDKFLYKCRWYEALIAHLQNNLLPCAQPLALLGDFNIVAEPRDIFSNTLTDDDATTHHRARQYYRSLINLGLIDSWSALYPDRVGYTYWDYKAGRWARDEGMRIDLVLLDGHLADRLRSCQVDRQTREQPRPSDHAPVWVDLSA